MKYIITSALLVSSVFASVVPRDNKKVDYSGFKLLRLENTAGLEAKIEELSAHVLNPGKSAELDVVVSPDNVAAISSLAKSKVINDDVGAILAEEGEMGVYAGKFSVYQFMDSSWPFIVPSESWFTAYHPYADHLTFLRDLQAGYTGNSEIITSGSSVQGRVLTGIHIWGSGGKGSKPAVLIHGTVHAREWITTMTTEYMAWQLLTKYASDANIKAAVDKFDFYIMPIVNPDGFVYSQTNDRLWRKNRKTVSGSSCVGTDVNRNWPYKWELTNGASTNPCSETYKGQAAGDTPENKGLVSQVQALKNSRGIQLYLDVHSYGQYILW
jgi:murein tripeptide amidase MpaA